MRVCPLFVEPKVAASPVPGTGFALQFAGVAQLESVDPFQKAFAASPADGSRAPAANESANHRRMANKATFGRGGCLRFIPGRGPMARRPEGRISHPGRGKRSNERLARSQTCLQRV